MLIKTLYGHVTAYFAMIIISAVDVSTLGHQHADAVEAFWKLGDLGAGAMVTPGILDGEVVANNLVQNGNNDFYKDSSLRDVEHLEHSSLWGHKYMGGGAGEGKQFLSPTGIFENKHEVKTDAVLPAYCDPPNPCPVGATADDGCLEEFENTAEFSRRYQANQDCLCDEDHMFACPAHHRKPSETLAEASDVEFQSFLDTLLNKADIKDQHKGLVAKKFHEKKRRVKRSTNSIVSDKKANETAKYLYWHGQRLNHIVAKKGSLK